MENDNVQEQDSNVQEEEVLETSNEDVEETQDEDADEMSERLAKAEELANNYKIRAEKAEKLAKSKSEAPSKQSHTAGNLNTSDVIYLAKADIHDDDMEEVLKYASANKLSMKDAHNYLKPIFDVKSEMRKTASASNTGSARRSSGKVSDEVLLSKASKGEMPEDSDEMARLVRARWGM